MTITVHREPLSEADISLTSLASENRPRQVSQVAGCLSHANIHPDM